MTETEKIAAVIVTSVKAAMAPMSSDIASMRTEMSALSGRMAAMESQHSDHMTAMKADMAVCQKGLADCYARMDALEQSMTKAVDLHARIDEWQIKLLDVQAKATPGQDGKDGKDGEPGKDGQDGKDGRDGRDGVQGGIGEKGIDGLAGKDGQDGKDGRDATLTLQELQIEQLSEREIVFKTGDQVLGSATFPIVLDRGVYAAGKSYEAGDGVTWAGSFWIAQGEMTDKPGDGQTSWRLAVKHGRDGKEGRPGKDGLHGRDGKDGKWPS